MNAGFLKKLYNSLPESIKSIFGSLIRKKLVENPFFKKQYKELLEADKTNDEVLKQKQLQLLCKTCIYAYEQTVYYKKIFDEAGFDPYSLETFEEFSAKVPILTKQMVLDNFDEINVEHITDDYPATTGGSSGTRLQINNAWETFYRENAFDYHFQSKLGYDYKKHKLLLLAGSESEKLCSASPLYNMIRVSGRYLTAETMQEAVTFINKNKPDYIKGIPSAVYQFCKYLCNGEYQLNCDIKGVFFRSENINPEQRKFIEETLRCPSIAFYGATERIAWAEEEKNIDGVPVYRFHPLYGYMELDSEDGETIISTGFINPKMPLIRYKTDDSAKCIENGLYTISGHRTTALVGKNGENISVEYFAHLEESFDKIEKYQLEQFEIGEVIVNIVPRRELSAEEMKEIEELFAKKCAYKLNIILKVVDNVILTPRGKFKLLNHSINE